MVYDRLLITVSGVVFLLAGCTAPDAFKPRSGERAAAGGASVAAPRVPVSPGSGVAQSGTTIFQVTPQQPGQATGTHVGDKIVALRSDLQRLQESMDQGNEDLRAIRQQSVSHAQRYHDEVAGIHSRLQLGTTPGNPHLLEAWNGAQGELEKVNADIGQMNALANRVAADAALSAYLLEATRASFGLSGAIDEDHKQLTILQDDVNRTTVAIDRLLTELSDDIRRQSNYVTNERNNLNTLALAIKNGEYFGASLAAVGQAVGGPAIPPAPRAAADNRRPLIVIRFDRPDVDYQQALYTAVNQVLQRQPDASFDLVAVSGSDGNAAQAALNANTTRRNARAVLRSLSDMGLPPTRVALSATTSQSNTNEVRLYLR